MKKIKLTQGKFVLVDDKDFKWLNQWRWNYQGRYARRIKYSAKTKKKTYIYMHRLITGVSPDMETDHIDHNSLNNQRNNLRIVTKSQNMWNMSLSKANTSGYKGVYWDKRSKKWNVKICVNWEKFDLGRFSDKKDAILVRKVAEEIYHAI